MFHPSKSGIGQKLSPEPIKCLVPVWLLAAGSCLCLRFCCVETGYANPDKEFGWDFPISTTHLQSVRRPLPWQEYFHLGYSRTAARRNSEFGLLELPSVAHVALQPPLNVSKMIHCCESCLKKRTDLPKCPPIDWFQSFSKADGFPPTFVGTDWHWRPVPKNLFI